MTHFQDSVYSLLLRFLKSKEFGSTTHFASSRKYFENKQIMFVTNFEDGVYSSLLRFLKSKEFGSTTHFASFQNFFENKQIMFATNFQDSEDKCIKYTVEIFKIKGVSFCHIILLPIKSSKFIKLCFKTLKT